MDAYIRMMIIFFVVLLAGGGTGACVSLPREGEKHADGGDEEPETFLGPFPYRSLMPLNLLFPHPPPEKAEVLEAGRTGASWNTMYGSSLVIDEKKGDFMHVDGEFLRTAVGLRHGLGSGIEVGFEIPYLHYTSGFLDSFIEDWHDFWGFSQGKRDQNPNKQYEVLYQHEGRTFLASREDGFHLGEIPLYLKVGLVDPKEEDYGLAARAFVELPTGSESKGFGSGKVDGGAGLLAQTNFSPSWAGYMSVDHVIRSDPDDFEGLEAANVTHASLGVEKAFFRSFAVVLQTDYQTQPLRSVHLKEFGDPEWTVTASFGWRLGRETMLKFSFTEDITTDSTPDFVVGMSLSTVF